jgi:hypothetical protein
MQITRRLFGLTAAALLASASAQAQTHTMTLAHVLSDQSPYQVTLNEFKRLIEERSAGDIAVEIQCCAQAGNETRAIQSMRTGILTGGFVGGSTLETVVPAYRVLSLPYLFENKQQAYEILQSDMGREMLDLLGEFEMHGLGFGSIYERSVASKAPAKVEGRGHAGPQDPRPADARLRRGLQRASAPSPRRWPMANCSWRSRTTSSTRSRSAPTRWRPTSSTRSSTATR